MSARLPEWIREKKLNLQQLHAVKTLLRANSLHSVCESLACPNRSECFSRGTATFILKPLERIAQLIIVPVLQVRFNRVDDFEQSARGAGGFGSTGKH